MEIEALLQLMRTCSLAKVRTQLELAAKKSPDAFKVIVSFYQAASKRK